MVRKGLNQINRDDQQCDNKLVFSLRNFKKENHSFDFIIAASSGYSIFLTSQQVIYQLFLLIFNSTVVNFYTFIVAICQLEYFLLSLSTYLLNNEFIVPKSASKDYQNKPGL